MPVITIELYEGRTVEQKREMAKAITDAVVRIGKTTPEGTHIIFKDIKKSDWATAGKLVSDA